ncbi:MAG: DUF4214 domain-containing protein [Acidimicrobiia bacterium]|nr:DUF4214 domain-containing protein [Acidimicrobiia bacterium]
MSANPTRLRFRHPARIRALCGFVLFVVVVVTALATAPPAGAAARLATARAELAPHVEGKVNGGATSANARFIVDVYQRLLGRSADNGGLDFHLSRLAAGGDRSRRALAYGLLFSAEGSRQEVRRAYDDLLGRQPDTAGEDYWTAHLQGRGLLELRVLLLASDEFRTTAGGTDDTWLAAVYLELLGRQPDAAGRAYWLGLLDAGVPRVLVAAGLYLSDEALGRRVDSYYVEAVGRTPSTAERNGAVSAIHRVGERGLRAQLWGSDEAFERYLQAALS